MKLEILGPGCKRCQQLAENAKTAVHALGIDAEIAKVTDMGVIAGYGIMATPALVVDGQVRMSGRVATPEEIEKLIGV